jgi:hypothetical protein
MHKWTYINRCNCSVVNKIAVYVEGLPSCVGLGAVVSKFSEHWFGASVRFSATFVGSSENPWSCSRTSS